MDTKKIENYIADQIHVWVWSGFYTKEDANDCLNDILEGDVDESKMRDLIDREFAEKSKQERDWPSTTNCDRLDMVFRDLNGAMIIAIQNAGHTMSDGLHDVGEIHKQKPHGTYRGYCFYHGQDLARAVYGGGLMLAYGDMRDTDDGKAEVAAIITKTLADHGFSFEWDGNVKRRINIMKINWQRRLK